MGVLAPLVTHILPGAPLPEASGGIQAMAGMLEMLVLPSANSSPPKSHQAQSPQTIFIYLPSAKAHWEG